MDAAAVSLLALLLCIAVSGLSHVNVGVLALAAAGVIGAAVAGKAPGAFMAGFPVDLFGLLFGVTLLFGFASTNGTLDLLARSLLRPFQGRRRLAPAAFFMMALVLSAAGPGNIAAIALLAPLVMNAAARMGLSPFLTALMLVTGVNAGALSPLAPTGLIALDLTARFGLEMNPWTQIFFPSLLAQCFIAAVSYAALGRARTRPPATADDAPPLPPAGAWTGPRVLTLVCLAVFVVGVAAFKAAPGFLSLTLAAVLMLADRSNQGRAVRAVPWDAIVMVCGVSTLVALLEETGGLELATDFLSRVADPATAPGAVAFVSGFLSVFSSSSGVVMPALIPLVPDLVSKLGGGDPAALVSSINVGSHVVDASPLSTLGALCLAAAPKEGREVLFRRLTVFGLCMTVFGAGVCQLFFG